MAAKRATPLPNVPPIPRKPGGQFAKGAPGRLPGATNKVTQSVREAFLIAFQERGGAKGLQEFADRSPENERVFYQLASKLIPQEIAGAGGGALLVEVVRRAQQGEPEPTT